MNLYLVTNNAPTSRWDVYDEFVIICATPDIARKTHPGGFPYSETLSCWVKHDKPNEPVYDTTWVLSADQVTVELVDMNTPGIVLASFCAG